MPTLFVFFGLRFTFYSNDHEPPHVHVIKGKGKVKDWAIFQVAPEIVMLENHGLDRGDLRMAQLVIEDNQEIIIANWDKFFGNGKSDKSVE